MILQQLAMLFNILSIKITFFFPWAKLFHFSLALLSLNFLGRCSWLRAISNLHLPIRKERYGNLKALQSAFERLGKLITILLSVTWQQRSTNFKDGKSFTKKNSLLTTETAWKQQKDLSPRAWPARYYVHHCPQALPSLYASNCIIDSVSSY